MNGRRFKWRKWNNVIHRDLGYLCVGLTLVYAISGIAVNHVADWNPNYRIQNAETHLEILPAGDPSSAGFTDDVLRRVGEAGAVRATFRPDPKTLQIFVDDGSTVTVDLQTGHVQQERVSDRRVLREANFLHLNHPKQLWTYAADAYAVALALLAITGLFVLKGKKGITGRGAWLTGVGILVPIAFLWLYL